MIELNLKFYEVEKDGLPKESGHYLCFAEKLYYTTLPFSARHKAFNCYDDFGKTDCEIDVLLWANYPMEFMKEVNEND